MPCPYGALLGRGPLQRMSLRYNVNCDEFESQSGFLDGGRHERRGG